MSNRIEQIVVLGGGTAGWMSAAFLQRLLNTDPRQKVAVTLVESEDIGILGVGEATLPPLKQILQTLGLEEAAFLAACDATFKMAIKFQDWLRPRGDGAAHSYWHPFADPPTVNGFSLANHWLEQRHRGQAEELAYLLSPLPALCDANLAPKEAGGPDYRGAVNYAYHLDAVKLGQYLREVAVGRGVRRIVDTVEQVGLDARGFVTHLATREHGDVKGDLFIDCSGFAGLIINKALGVPFVGYGDVLFCDRAVAMRVPYADRTATIPPYTKATALDAGWVWDIGLQARRGTGYVYSSQFASADEAEAEIRRYAGPGSEKLDAKHLKMRVGRSARAWEKNCVAIGLSGGFLEPLESTGIHSIQAGLFLLLDLFPDRGFDPALAARYNRHMTALFEEFRDFIAMHYVLTRREDTPFWQANRRHERIPESLTALLDLWRQKVPGPNDLDSKFEIFRVSNWTHILAGMEHLPAKPPAVPGLFDPAHVTRIFAKIRADGAAMKRRLPDHRAYFGQAEAPGPAKKTASGRARRAPHQGSSRPA